MARADLQEIVLEDFSAGIWDDWQAGGSALSAPLGAAQMTGTFGCLSARGGGLIPGPRRVNRVLETLIDGTTTADYPTNDKRVHITAFRCASPVLDRSAAGITAVGTVQPFPDNLCFGFDWYWKSGGTPWKHRQMVRLYKMFLASAANPSQGSLTTYNLINNTSTGTIASAFKNGWCGIDLNRSRTAAPSQPGYPIIAAIVTDNKEVTTMARVAYPDDQAGTTDSTRAMAGLDQSGGFAAYSILGHQDRIVALDRSVNYVFGANAELPTDILIATAVNDIATNGVAISSFVSENPGLFGAWASVNASELFFVKQQRGGFVMRGDIAYPTVVRLPGLTPTYDAVNVPCVSSNGMVVYGSRDGVYGWGGGDVSTPLSPQLNGWFWKIPAGANGFDGVDNFLHSKGTFAAFQQYVAAPNNYLLDTTTGGWWRLTDPTASGERPYCHYDTSAAGYLIGVPAYFDATNQTIADYYDFDRGQSSYAWVSQPLRASMNRELEFREIDLMAQGTGQIIITLTGIGGTTASITFDIASESRPVLIQQPAGGIHAHDVVLSFTSIATDSSLPAPRVHRIVTRYNPRQTARATSS